MNSPRSRFHAKASAMFRALAHPARLRIMEILLTEEACVCHLEARLGLRQAYVSQQLSVLKDARLVNERRVGTFIHYRAANPDLGLLLEAARQALGLPRIAPATFDPTKCGCPRCELSHQPMSR